MSALGRRRGLACTLALLAGVAAPGAAAGAKARTGSELADRLRAGQAFVERGLIIEGPLELAGTDSVSRVFRCRRCTFRGRVSAPDVTFERAIDLSGSVFEGRVDFRGAHFRATALFGAAPLGAEQPALRDCPREEARKGASVFRKEADFSLAVFDDPADFVDSRFCEAALFRDARFADATFNRARFMEAPFDGASFRGAALFTGAVFNGPAAFGDADFHDRSDFSLARFKGGADFTRAQFAERVSFLAAGFSSPTDVTFQTAAAGDDLNFTSAFFVRSKLVFSHFVSAGSLVLRGATLTKVDIAMDRLQVRSLILDVEDVSQIDDKRDQRVVLQTIEESAKERRDLTTANDAHYALQALQSEDYWPVVRELDYVVYRNIAGYFVRPAHPLLVLLGLVTLASLWRMRRLPLEEKKLELPRRSPRMRTFHRAQRRCSHIVTCIFDTFSLVGPRWGRGRESKPGVGERMEVIAYRLLLVCILLGLANSNPTLRQMVDTLL